MGFIKGGLVFFIGFVLFFSFLIMNLSLALTLSLSYNNVQSNVKNVITESVNGNFNFNEKINEKIGNPEEYCQNHADYVFYDDNTMETFVIPCEVLKQGPNAVEEHSLSSYIDIIYNKDYNCGYWTCFAKGNPLFLISKQSKDYWNSIFYISLFVSLILLGLMFLFMEKRENVLIYPAILLVVSAVPLVKAGAFLSSILGLFVSFSGFTFGNQLLSESIIKETLFIFFSKGSVVFSIMLIIAIVCIALGIALKFWRIEGFFSKIFSKTFSSSSSSSDKLKTKTNQDNSSSNVNNKSKKISKNKIEF